MTTTTIPFSIEAYVATVRRDLAFDEGRSRATALASARLAPATEAVRRELDRELFDGGPMRGLAKRIAKKLKFDPDVQAYRSFMELVYQRSAGREDQGHSGQADRDRRWVQRVLTRLMKKKVRSPSPG